MVVANIQAHRVITRLQCEFMQAIKCFASSTVLPIFESPYSAGFLKINALKNTANKRLYSCELPSPKGEGFKKRLKPV
jgi:hypothetical protein